MKIKQKIAHYSVALLAFSFVVFGVAAVTYDVVSAAPDKCEGGDDNGSEDCFDKHYKYLVNDLHVNMTEQDFRKLVDDCNNYDGNSGNDISTGFGSCTNAATSCYEHVIDAANVCKDPKQLAWGVFQGCDNAHSRAHGLCSDEDWDGDLKPSSWDEAIEEYDDQNGGAAAAGKTNRGIKSDNIRALRASAAQKCAGLYPGDAQKQRDCVNAAEQAMKDCYNQLTNNGSDSDKPNGDVNACTTQKRTDNARNKEECEIIDGAVWAQNDCKTKRDAINSATNEAECTAAGGVWVSGQSTQQGSHAPPNKCKESGPGICSHVDQAGKTTHYEMPPSGHCDNGDTSGQASSSPAGPDNNYSYEGKCGRARTVLLPAGSEDVLKNGGCQDEGLPAIGAVLKFVIFMLSVGVGIAAVGGIVYGAVLYTSARDSAGQVQQAITIIRNVVIGLLLYVFMVAILNFIVPGGVIT